MPEPVVSLVDVARTYPGTPPVPALRHVTMRVAGGERVAIVGPSGSGKSTFLNLVGLLDEPTAGRRLLAGVDVEACSEKERTALRATTFGFVFQAFHLVPYLDCLRNVMVPLVHQAWSRHERRDRAADALAAVGMAHRIAARPTTLSGGEQQRVAIARAIVHDPAVVLCDEPTGNLDRTNTEAVLEILSGLATSARAVVVVSHDHRVEEWADRAVAVVDGVAVAGDHATG